MPVIQSLLNPKSAGFTANQRRMHERLAEVRALEAMVVAESEASARNSNPAASCCPEKESPA